MATVGSLVVRIGTDISGLEAGLQRASGRLRSAGRSMQQIGTGLTLGVSAPLGLIASSAVMTAADFERSMNVLQATSGATATEMATLQAQALELGAVTAFSAGDAASAMLELAKAGMDVSQVSGAIPGVLDLAAAANLGLGEAAAITSNALNTFGLDATAAGAVANTLAAAANASSADVGDLAQGMQMAGAVFAANGQSVQDLAAGLALLANNGIAGSDAGTSLKTMMMRLAAPTKEAAGVMSELGLNMYDAQGAMAPFADIVAQLEGATNGMTDAQRNAALSTIFGADAIRAATILTAAGSEGFAAMATAVNEQGAASTMADANMKGLSGAIEAFKGSVETAMISGATPFLETMKGMVLTGAELVNQFATLPAPVQQTAAVMLGLAVVAGPLLLILGTMAGAIAGLLSPIGLVVVGLVTLGAVLVANWGAMSAMVTRVVKAVLKMLTPFAEQLSALFGPSVERAKVAFDELVANWDTVAATVSGAVTSFAQQLATFFGPIVKRVREAFGGLVAAGAWLVANWDSVSAMVSGAMGGMLATLKSMAGRLGALFGPAVERAKGAFDDLVTNWDTVAAMASGAVEGMLASLTSFAEQLSALFGPSVERVKEAFNGLVASGIWLVANWDAVAATVSGAVEGMLTTLTSLAEQLGALFGPVVEWVKGAFGGLVAAGAWLVANWDSVAAMVSGAVEGMLTTLTSLAEQLGALFGPGVERVKEALGGLVASFENPIAAVMSFWEEVKGPILALGGLLVGVFAVTAVFAVNLFAGVLTALPGLIGPFVDQATLLLDTIGGVFTHLGEIVMGVLTGDWALATEGAQGLTQTFADFVTGTFDNLSSAVGTAMPAIGAAVVNTLTDLGVDAEPLLADFKSTWEGVWNTLTGSVTTVTGAVEAMLTTLTPFAEQLGALFGPSVERVKAAFGGLGASFAALGPSFEALMAAVLSLWEGIKGPILALGALLAGVFGVTALFAVNLFAGAMAALPGLIGPFVDQVTLLINTVVGIFTNLGKIVFGVLTGDWALATEGAQGLTQTFADFVTGTFDNLSSAAGTAMTAIWEAVVNTLTDLGVDVEPLLASLKSTWEGVWNTLVGFVTPVTDAVVAVQTAIEDFQSWLSTLAISNPFDGWSFPSLPSWMGGPAESPAHNAVGTPAWPGGLSVVGEFGPELVYVPGGSRIFSNRDSEELMGGGPGGVTIGQVVVNQDLDWEQLRWRLEEMVRRRGR